MYFHKQYTKYRKTLDDNQKVGCFLVPDFVSSYKNVKYLPFNFLYSNDPTIYLCMYVCMCIYVYVYMCVCAPNIAAAIAL